MKAAIEPGDRQFLERLHELGGGTVQEICADLGVTATAVRQRLVRLQGLKMVARELVRAGRGRPHHVYRVTQAGLCELGDNYAELAQILWREMNNIEEPAVRARVVSRIEDALVEQFGKVAPQCAARRPHAADDDGTQGTGISSRNGPAAGSCRSCGRTVVRITSWLPKIRRFANWNRPFFAAFSGRT